MSKMRKKRMQRIVSLILVVLLCLSLVGCGSPESKPEDKPAASEPEESKPAASEPAGSDAPKESGDSKGKEEETAKPAAKKPANASESYLEYMEAKSELSSLITDALSSNSDIGLEDTMSLLGVVMVEMSMLPASSMGLGLGAAEAGLGFLGAEDVQYTEDGNRYIITYNSQDGEGYEFEGVYDEAADALVSSNILVDDNGGIYYEYRRMPFGYVGQAYAFEGDTVTELFKIVVHDTGGVIGISYDSGKPGALTGSESKDFAKDCSQWYAIDGTAVTGVSSAGQELNFEYIPEPSTE